jgi:D-sedoheptulose 7-phosphate isomerase
VSGDGSRDTLRALVARRFEWSTALPTHFFATHADVVSRACLAMAERFERGGRLLVFGAGAAATDAQHVAVEFVHPILVGKRALPAIALTADVASLTGVGRDGVDFGRLLATLGRPHDVALAIAHDDAGERLGHALEMAHARGMLTIALGVAGTAPDDGVDFVFAVPAVDPLVAQEVHETLYHVLWELVHVFLDRGASSATTCAPDPDGHCALCGDDAEPGVVVDADHVARTATVRLAAGARTVATDLVERVAAGDTLLVHQGFAIARLEPAR